MDHLIKFEKFSYKESDDNRIIGDILNIASDKGYQAGLLTFSFSQMGIWLSYNPETMEEVINNREDSMETFTNVLNRLDNIIDVKGCDIVKWSKVETFGTRSTSEISTYMVPKFRHEEDVILNMDDVINAMRKGIFNCGVRLFFDYQN